MNSSGDLTSRTKSSPFYVQSNGMTERAVQEAKRLLIKTKFGTPDFYNALLEVRSTPRSDLLGSPCQRLMARQPRTQTPCTTAQLMPRVIKAKFVRAELRKLKDAQKKYYERTAHELTPLMKNEGVRILDPSTNKWTPGIAVKILNAPRSYQVNDTGSEKKYRRTMNQLRSTKEAVSAPITDQRQPPATPTSSSENTRMKSSRDADKH